ncbi:hypothetical protein J6590_062594 [Homalodisca vitripennis]|nr:hypothetical protein J6590_062594 [Homalodisca vitripennis]
MSGSDDTVRARCINAVPSTESKKDKMRNVTINASGAIVNSRCINAVPSTESNKDKIRKAAITSFWRHCQLAVHKFCTLYGVEER